MLRDILSRVNMDGIVLDIGANIGNHTLFLAAHGINVHSFEANIELYNIMNKSIEINNFNDKVTTYNFGVSDKKGIASFQNLDKTNLGGQSLTIGKGSIELQPLSNLSFNKKISVMKIDVEGMETNVLNGAIALINKDRPILYIEAINLNEYKKIAQLLEKFSYVYWDTFNATSTHLFLPQESVSEKLILSQSLIKNTSGTYRMTQSLNYSKRFDKNITEIKNILDNKIDQYYELKDAMSAIKLEKLKLEEELSDSNNQKLKLEEELSDSNNQKLKLEEELSDSNNQKLKLEELSEKSLKNFIGMQARNKTLTAKYKINFDGLEARNKQLTLQINKNQENFENLKKTLSFRWGNSLVKSTKSFSEFLKLPITLYQDHQEFKKFRNKNKKIKKSIKDNLVVNLILKEFKVASIMDEFTYNSFRYECDLLQLTPNDWKKELLKFKPDLVFIESAWKGKDDLWATKISNCSSELIEMVQWCHDNNIKTMFWNKEDPVHFDTFITVAKMVDYVFTTDIDCVPRYKNEVGHNHVNFLPFAAQPEKHNPTEIYDRKDAFNFAGSYYLRYPERQRDFASLIDAVKKFKPVDIYDRNFDNPHPHYTFPDEYKSMILGKLPFEEIDKAYKGYKYGINMNTIKQSQSMFARRVFELLASNTVVVSNFSKGVRLLFGDLVISSDNSKEISTQLEKVCNDALYYKKHRLLGLRKVMEEHTYADRLSFIVSKINHTEYKKQSPSVYIYAVVKNKKEYDNVVNSFDKQSYKNKFLILYKKFKDTIENISENITLITTEKVYLSYILNINDESGLFGVINSLDYYGESYLIDLVHSSSYSKCDAFGKGSYYEYKKDSIELKNDNGQYKPTGKLSIDSSLIKLAKLTESLLKDFSQEKMIYSIDKMISIDEFNYCKNGMLLNEKDIAIVQDLDIGDKGISFIEKLSKISSELPPKEKQTKDDSTLPSISSKELFELFIKPASSKIKLSFSNNKFNIVTKLGAKKHSYIYLENPLTRQELNMVLNSQFTLVSNNTLEDMRTVFEFQDKDNKKISHSMNPAGGIHAIAIPRECVYIRFGLKLVGNGKATISKLVLGTHGEIPFAIVGKSKKLVLTKQYPSYEDIYKYGFLHSRVRAYKQEGLLVDIFRINNQSQKPYREFEDVDVTTGDAELLEETLKIGQYDHVLVHLIDENIWKILEKFIDKIKVTVWVHGAEIQVWQQRDFEFVDMDQKEIERQKRLSNNRVKFWNSLVSKNLHFVFVSNWLLKSSEEYLKLKFNPKSYSIIHNNIDSNVFDYRKKQEKDRLNILSIRPYVKRVYGNDLTVKAIKLLSKKDFFDELTFTIVGDGELWEETVTPLKNFKNINLINKFLLHSEISEYHKKNGILLVPTRMDTQGVSRDEAMSSGLVPITTNVAAIPEFVDSSCGMVVEPENPQALADAIEFLYKNPNKFLELSKAASERVRRQCGLKQTIKKEMALIDG